MNYKLPITILILLITQFSLVGQEDNQVSKRLNLNLGLTNEALKDKVFSDIKFQGIVFLGALEFEKITDKIYWSASIAGKYGTVDYKNEYFPTDYIDLRLSFRYAKFINSGKLSAMYVGGLLRSGLNIFDFNGFDNGSWMSGHSFGFFVRKKYNIVEGHELIGSFEFPLFSLFSRPPYAGRDEFVFSNTDNIPKILFSRNKFYTVNKLVNPIFKLRYTYGMKKIKFNGDISYEYLFLNSVQKYFRNSFGFSIGITYEM